MTAPKVARSLACRRCHRGWMNAPDFCSECTTAPVGLLVDPTGPGPSTH